jgi:phospholipid/cholesterol/gamma-HCH transport system permease protein
MAMTFALDVRDDPRGRTAMVRPRGDLMIGNAGAFFESVASSIARRDVDGVVVSFADVGRIDSAAVAVVSLGSRMAASSAKRFELEAVAPAHRAALALALSPPGVPPRLERPGAFERLGERLLAAFERVAEAASLIAATAREVASMIARRRGLPRSAIVDQAIAMGVGALPIVGLLGFLLGMTLAFQAAVQLEQLAAGVFVADFIGVSMVREFGPLITAIIVTGRTGAAIAAELGTMCVGSEIDALRAMGVSPVRFLVAPRLVALTAVQPALTMFAIFVGVAGGMVVASSTVDLMPAAFWDRMVQRVTVGDLAHGFAKSVIFAWIIGFAGSYLGLATRGDANSVGVATTRTVVISIFLIIVVDSVFATAASMGGD